MQTPLFRARILTDWNLLAGTNRRISTATTIQNSHRFFLCSTDTDRKENTISNTFSLVSLITTAESCLPCRCLAMDIFSGTAVPGFVYSVTICFPYLEFKCEPSRKRQEKVGSNTFSLVPLFTTAESCLPCRCLAMDVVSGTAVPGFIHHVTIYFPYLEFKREPSRKPSWNVACYLFYACFMLVCSSVLKLKPKPSSSEKPVDFPCTAWPYME
jgi:hypothetical protein